MDNLIDYIAAKEVVDGTSEPSQTQGDRWNTLDEFMKMLLVESVPSGSSLKLRLLSIESAAGRWEHLNECYRPRDFITPLREWDALRLSDFHNVEELGDRMMVIQQQLRDVHPDRADPEWRVT